MKWDCDSTGAPSEADMWNMGPLALRTVMSGQMRMVVLWPVPTELKA